MEKSQLLEEEACISKEDQERHQRIPKNKNEERTKNTMKVIESKQATCSIKMYDSTNFAQNRANRLKTMNTAAGTIPSDSGLNKFKFSFLHFNFTSRCPPFVDIHSKHVSFQIVRLERRNHCNCDEKCCDWSGENDKKELKNLRISWLQQKLQCRRQRDRDR